MPSKKAATVKRRPGGKKRVGLTSALGPKMTTILVISVIAGGIALAARQRDQVKSKLLTEESVMTDDSNPASPVPAGKGSKSRPATAAARPADAPALPKPIATITGCLERDGNSFRLKDTAGTSAPKSRSWKSGFLKKGSASIAVVDASRTLRLGNQVGRRVTVSGTLVDREMRADSVQQVAASCKAN